MCDENCGSMLTEPVINLHEKKRLTALTVHDSDIYCQLYGSKLEMIEKYIPIIQQKNSTKTY